MTVEAVTNVNDEPMFIGPTMEWLKMIGVVLELKLPALSNAPLVAGVLRAETIEPILAELPQLEGKIDDRLLKGFKAALEKAQTEKSALALV